jgi:hypothetical protein
MIRTLSLPDQISSASSLSRPDQRSMAWSGDIYSEEIYQLMIGFVWAHHRV